ARVRPRTRVTGRARPSPAASARASSGSGRTTRRSRDTSRTRSTREPFAATSPTGRCAGNYDGLRGALAPRGRGFVRALPRSPLGRPGFAGPVPLKIRGEALHRVPKEAGDHAAGQRCTEAREQPRLERERPPDARLTVCLNEFEQLDLRLREWHRGTEDRPGPPRRVLPVDHLLHPSGAADVGLPNRPDAIRRRRRVRCLADAREPVLP